MGMGITLPGGSNFTGDYRISNYIDHKRNCKTFSKFDDKKKTLKLKRRDEV
jgi:hypothetical protein